MNCPKHSDKKYTYFHKKLGKKMFNNQLFKEDVRQWDQKMYGAGKTKDEILKEFQKNNPID